MWRNLMGSEVKERPERMKRRKVEPFLIGAFSLLFLSQGSFAKTLLPDSVSVPSAVVKITSQLCGKPQSQFQGSGILFTSHGRIFALTSEHVLLHGNSGLCHAAWNEVQGELRAKFLTADWGTGLGLLEILSPTKPQGLPTLDTLFPAEVKEQDRVLVAGFPHRTKKLIADDRGYVLVAEGRRHLLPQLSSVIEIDEAHGEYGMSGGPVFSANKDHVVGILSHQYISLVPGGGPSELGEFSARSTVIEAHLLAIPATAISSWLGNYFSNPSQFKPSFVRDPLLQLNGTEAVFAGNLRFELEDSPETGDPNPVGGPDGVGGRKRAMSVNQSVAALEMTKMNGIGGSGAVVEEKGKAKSFATVRVYWDTEGRRTQWYLPQKDAWLKGIQANSLILTRKVEIPFFLQRDKESGKLLGKLRFTSLAQFFRILSQSDAVPVTLIRSKSSSDTAQETQLKELSDLGKSLAQSASALKSGKVAFQVRELLQSVGLVGELASSENWQLVSVADIDELINDPSWKDLTGEESFREVVTLLNYLNRIKELLVKLKL